MGRFRLALDRFRFNWEASRAVRERVRFCARETLARHRVDTYRLDGDLRVVVRHPLVDAYLVHEVLTGGEYDLPAPVRERLEGNVTVLDLGGNIGLFALHIHRQIDCRVTSFEPDPRNAEILRRCVDANPRLDWEIVEAAAGVHNGTVEFISDFGLARVADVADAFGLDAARDTWIPPHLRKHYPAPLKVTVPAIDVMPYIAECDLLKIDIEGSEWPLLADPRFNDTTARAIVIEAHAKPGRIGECASLLERTLGAAGFTQLRPWREGQHADTIWAVR